MKLDLHTHYYPPAYFETVRNTHGDFSFGTDPTGRTIITYKGARFFGVTPPMTDVAQRLADMDRVGIDVEVVSLSTPNVFFAEGAAQVPVARMVNDAYAALVAKHPARFKGFASIPRHLRAAAERCGAAQQHPRPRAHRSGVSALFRRSQPDEAVHLPASDAADALRAVQRIRARPARDLVGADHMVMGSDYPHLLGSIERSVSSIQNLAVPEAEKERIFSGTALSILNNV